MRNLNQTRRSIESAQDLHGLVKTMKAMAAVGLRQFLACAEASQQYRQVLEAALSVVLPDPVPESPSAAVVAVVFGSDQGLCGPFNESLATFAAEHLPEPPHRVIAVGSRLDYPLRARGWQVDHRLSLPTSVPAITQTTGLLLTLLEQATQHRLLLFFHHPLGGARYQPDCLQVLPLDPDWLDSLRKRPWQARCLPMFRGDRPTLTASLVRHWIFLSIYRGLAYSLAAENAARLASMQVAEKNIQERLDELRGEFHSLRQNAITDELLDIVSGFEVIAGEKA
ncbi:MAG: F0F1 ATP synthase subunit gamma [Candidatus Eremiobacteraeota bacterium]|nr:F0F1 ATP synthase subunit gamma [Candidatus Eremiobacteraeota bacterium]